MGEVHSTVSLLERARNGDQAALDALFAHFLPRLRRWASGRLPRAARHVADTHDLVQDVLLQTFRNIASLEGTTGAALQAYLRQAVLNRVRDELRRSKRRPDMTDIDGNDVACEASPLEQMLGAEALDRYEDALATLRPDEREAIVGRLEMGYSYRELAAILDKPSPEAARKAAARAVARLVEEMQRGR